MHINALSFRLLVSAGLVLTAFFILALFVLEQGFRQSAEQTLKEKLQIKIYALLSLAEMDESGYLVMPEDLQDSRLHNPSSGLYAVIRRSSYKTVWRSPSSIAVEVLPLEKFVSGKPIFLEGKENRFVLHYGFSWRNDRGIKRKYVISLAEDGFFVSKQVERFRSTLQMWFFSVGIVLVLIQFVVLRWSLKPLRQIVTDLTAIEKDQKSCLDGDYPYELLALTRNLNAFIHSERAHLERYRNTLGDLSHSLKTPLAILNGCLQTPEVSKHTMQKQIARMDEIIEYQLQKAAAKGQRKLITPIQTDKIVKKIISSLKKVYQDKALEINLTVKGSQLVYCEEGDMYEMVGNLLDNAAKWCHKKINVSLIAIDETAISPYSFVLTVEDDGAGIAADKLLEILQRGVRADENVTGHGIGMAITVELVELLGGKLAGANSQILGGMQWKIYLP